MTRSEKSKWPIILIIASLLIIAILGLMVVNLSLKQSQDEGLAIPADKAKIITLYYALPEQDGFIDKEIKIIKDQSIQETMRLIIEKMVRQPLVRKKYPWWPEVLALRSAYSRDNGLLILDFEKQVQYNHSIGAYEELLLIRSIVKTMTENFNHITKILFLVGGQETETLAGHVDITRPLSHVDLY